MSLLKTIKEKFLDAVYPTDYKCVICGREIFDKGRYIICDFCKLEFNNQRYCHKCGCPTRGDKHDCPSCKGVVTYYDKARCALVYEGNAQKLVRGFKYGNKRYLAGFLGALIADQYKKSNFNADLIMPAPISEQRRKIRGYNQSELLAQTLSEITGVPCDAEALFKCADVEYQARLGREARFKQVKGVFGVNADIDIIGKNIALVDDVMTTGATVNELARILKNRGAASVYVFVLARPVFE